jgi:hypothetical protein
LNFTITVHHTYDLFHTLSNMSNQTPCEILPVPIAIPRITSATRTSTLNYYGPVESSLVSETSKFLSTVTDTVELEIVSTIDSFVSATQHDCIGEAQEKKAY